MCKPLIAWYSDCNHQETYAKLKCTAVRRGRPCIGIENAPGDIEEDTGLCDRCRSQSLRGGEARIRAGEEHLKRSYDLDALLSNLSLNLGSDISHDRLVRSGPSSRVSTSAAGGYNRGRSPPAEEYWELAQEHGWDHVRNVQSQSTKPRRGRKKPRTDWTVADEYGWERGSLSGESMSSRSSGASRSARSIEF